ncbi:hypothetical protein KIN34_03715 [Cellulomonas sp. DKR-3]|uniref:Uncharacterized protein n=1 Tax=Cellulomonas fulva TaxID=2835530 RepID=A0ABS5TW60_9CELL|nr:hypothetical protein [Cellulomonas fulva]MBT0993392.1 hypothetical protein [Cellulomonas fulva]
MSTPEQATRPSRGHGVWIAVVSLVVVAVLVAVGAWAATTGDDEPAGAASSTSPTAGTDPSDPSSGAPTDTATDGSTGDGATPTSAAGCPAGGDAVPAGADVRPAVDVDGDGQPDKAWISAGADRRFGITTASGATFSVPIDSASPQRASAVVNVVQREELPIALVDTGREALLYSLTGCAVTAVQNAQGRPYTFDRGFGDEGTGVGCVEDGGFLRLAGLDADPTGDGTRFDVERTWVDLDPTGRTATNGDDETVAEGVTADDPALRTAQEVSCGDLRAGRDGPLEPRS